MKNINDSQKIVAIVQARMGSSRLPGKVLESIEGKPMLWHVINRLKTCALIHEIVVATTVNQNDAVIENFCKEHEIDVFRGSEEDVLDRYYQAAKIYSADIVVRITSDCAVIDPRVTDHVISRYLENQDSYDFCSNVLIRTYPNGLETEVVPFHILELIWKEAREDWYREHVTFYLANRPDLFRLVSVVNDEDLSYLRWTVDQREDLDLIREIYKRLYQDGRTFYMEDIVEVFKREPHLAEINKNVRQKTVVK